MADNALVDTHDDGRICDMRRRREATIEDLYRVGEDVKAELVNGELVIMTPGGGLHGWRAAAPRGDPARCQKQQREEKS